MPADKLTEHDVQTLRQDYPDHIGIRYIEKSYRYNGHDFSC